MYNNEKKAANKQNRTGNNGRKKNSNFSLNGGRGILP